MSILNLVEKDQATGRVAEIYDQMIANMGFIPNAFKVFSPSEFLLDKQTASLGYFMRHKTLGGNLLAFIRLLVSEYEVCEYCVGINTMILMQYGVLPEAQAEIRKDPSKAPLEKKELALLLFVLKVVKDSNSVVPADVDNLRTLGWSDAEILEATYHGALQSGVVKIFNAFKIKSDM